jgi:uncharacterized protein (TIGR02117 family)
MLKVGRLILRWAGYFTEFVCGMIALYLTIAILLSLIPWGDDAAQNGIKIYVKTNGVHTDLCLPVVTDEMDWRNFLPLSHFPNVRAPGYVSMGWGDKGFFLETPTWADLKFSTAFNAAFTGSETAMHVSYHENEPVLSPSTRQKFVSPEKYRDLIEYIKDSFRLKDAKVELIPGKGYGSNDNFYEANGSYHLFNTCNAWTNGGLKVAGIRTAVLALFSDGIMRHLD